MNLPLKYSEVDWKARAEARREYCRRQKWLCLHCNHILTGPPPKSILAKRIDWSRFPSGFCDYPIHLHHDHNTDLTLGAVHAYCNAVMWQYHGK